MLAHWGHTTGCNHDNDIFDFQHQLWNFPNFKEALQGSALEISVDWWAIWLFPEIRPRVQHKSCPDNMFICFWVTTITFHVRPHLVNIISSRSHYHHQPGLNEFCWRSLEPILCKPGSPSPTTPTPALLCSTYTHPWVSFSYHSHTCPFVLNLHSLLALLKPDQRPQYKEESHRLSFPEIKHWDVEHARYLLRVPFRYKPGEGKGREQRNRAQRLVAERGVKLYCKPNGLFDQLHRKLYS